jgi:hypothetical protein
MRVVLTPLVYLFIGRNVLCKKSRSSLAATRPSPAEREFCIATLAVIEQTDDEDFLEKGTDAFDEVLSQYGLKREEAYRYSVSSAKTLGPMQFTDRRGHGTYSFVVRSWTPTSSVARPVYAMQ